MMTDITNPWLWAGFAVFIILALGLDTFFLDKLSHKRLRPADSIQAAWAWTLIWIASALVFNALLWFYLYLTEGLWVADEKALDFFTGYLIEKALSIDNLFAFFLIFHQFRIPAAYQQRIFSYGIWSAIVLRLLLILLGTWLIIHFHWVLYLMGAFLLLTGIKMLFVSQQEKDLYSSKTFRWLKKHLRITQEIHGQRFLIKRQGVLYATPLLLALIFIEISDVIFAFDSIPAIFAITTDPFIVWTSNIFAILGLRALYFVLQGMITRFHLLKYGIALILVFVGMKMVMAPWIIIPVGLSLAIIMGFLIVFSGLSLMCRPR